jgi:phosphoglycolate phosphatase-like HAD superfamily hydrolase
VIRIRPVPEVRVRAALFDFDGTVSLIREGWQEIMIGFMVETILEVEPSLTVDELRAHVSEYVARLTGKQTIYQMIQLAEEIESRGGRPLEPLEYKREYHDRLWAVICDRIEGLESGRYLPEDWLVPGSNEILGALKQRGIDLYLASGTDLEFVRKEVRLLGLDSYFEDRVYGALDDYKAFSKRQIIDRLLEEERLGGRELVAFGDGYVEIEEIKQVGGTAVGVASDEKHRAGYDEWKKRRLTEAGADLIVADFRETDAILAELGM